MKKILILVVSILLVFLALPATAQSLASKNNETAKNKSRKVYCLEMHYPDWGKSYGIASFYTGDLSKFELVQDLSLTNIGGGDNAVFSGAAANDVYYGYFYKYSIVDGFQPFCLATVNIRNGETRQIINFKLNLDIPKLNDLTYDYNTQTMYAVAYVGARYQLYTVDLNYGTLTPGVVIQEGSKVNSIAASEDGQLYGFGNNGNLIKINKSDGTVNDVVSTGMKAVMSTSLEFDHTDGTLYGACFQSPGPGSTEVTQGTTLIKFDLKNKTFETLGKIEGAKLFGMYIPFLKSGFDAPEAPADLKVVVGEKGAEEAAVSWKNPVKTYGQDALSAISTVKLFRDGEEMATFTSVTPGQEMSWEDHTVKTGTHVYSICAVNEVGEGDLGKIDCFVGKDTPGLVNKLGLRVNSGYDNATLTWDVPTEGSRKNYFDTKGLTYTVVRYPDSLVVAKNITELTYTDKNIKRLALYYYSVTASNASGQGLETYSIQSIIGKPKEVPYNTFFDNNAEIQNNWSGSDHNGDGNTWIFNLGAGQGAFGNSDRAAEYKTADNNTDADDWLISPPFSLKSGSKYTLSFDTRSLGRDSLVISLLTIDKPRLDLKSVNVEGESPAKDQVAPWITTRLELPADIQAGAYCVGIKIATPWGSSGYLQLTNFSLKEVFAIAVESESVALPVRIFSSGGILSIDGEFSSVDVYNAAGWLVGHTGAGHPFVDTNNWNPGIYFVRVARGETPEVYKVAIK